MNNPGEQGNQNDGRGTTESDVTAATLSPEHVSNAGQADGLPTGESEASNAASNAATGQGETAVMNIQELNNEIKKTIENLKTKLQDIQFDELQNDMKIEDVCQKISDKNLLGEFDKELYKTLNKFFSDDNYSTIEVGPEGNAIPLRVRGNLSQLVYSKIINGKMEDPLWPSDDQKKMFKESLKKSMVSKMTNFFKSKKNKPPANTAPVDNANAAAANPNAAAAPVANGNSNNATVKGGSKKLIVKRKRKYIRKK